MKRFLKSHVLCVFHTKATFIVDSIDEWRAYLLEQEGIIIRDKKQVPTGYNMTVKHGDGTIVEYVQYSKRS